MVTICLQSQLQSDVYYMLPGFIYLLNCLLICLQVLERLPVVNVAWKHPKLVQAKSNRSSEGSPAGQEYQLDVQLTRVAGKKAGSGLARVYAPRFPKVSSAINQAMCAAFKSCCQHVQLEMICQTICAVFKCR